MTTKHENIYQAMAAVMEEVGYVKKQRSAGLNYSYAGEAALIEALRPAMVEHGVFVFVKRYFNLGQTEYTINKDYNGQQKTTRMTNSSIQATICFMHESGTFIDVESAGEAADAGDKSVNKAMTGAYKYALRQTFCIETGDDPDKYPSEPKATPAKPAAKSNSGWIQPADEAYGVQKMTLETATGVTGHDGAKYGDIETKKLASMINSMQAVLDGKQENKAGYSNEEYQFRIDAAKAIIASRK